MYPDHSGSALRQRSGRQPEWAAVRRARRATSAVSPSTSFRASPSEAEGRPLKNFPFFPEIFFVEKI
jgi:hypothetical protein